MNLSKMVVAPTERLPASPVKKTRPQKMVTGMSRGPASCFGPDNVAQFQPEKKEKEIKRNNQSNYYEKNGYLNKINVIEQIQKEKKGFTF